ncbi:MAG: DUF3048 domain-containing protein [Bilifractor sp.]|jgi:hypothetical protein
MKRQSRVRLAAAVSAIILAVGSLSGCEKARDNTDDEDVSVVSESVTPLATETPTPTAEVTQAASTPPAGMYFSELTGEPVSLELQNQRPVAVMVDNEKTAYEHYGIAEGDVVYELMNSTMNGRITRMMVLVKDWKKIQQMGSIRSARSTNIILAGEWNAVLCHDGGPRYVDEYFAKDYAKEHFSGTFSRVNNGKPREFTEYVCSGDLENNFAKFGYSTEYNEFRPERDSHFQFVDYNTETDLSGVANVKTANTIALPFEHTTSTLTYNTGTKTYDLSCYGSLHKDAEDGQVASFKNVILQCCSYTMYDNAGYMIYNVVQQNQAGYYITNGHAEPITWSKESETGITKYYGADGKEISINRGKTYISLIPDDSWNSLSIT